MDITNRRFKIVERITGFFVLAELPSVKHRRKWFGLVREAYYDESVLVWVPITTDGEPMRKGVLEKGPARFAKYAEAKQFIERVREPKRETIIGILSSETPFLDDHKRAVKDALRKQNGKASDMQLRHDDLCS